MANEVVVPLTFKADAKGLVTGSASGKKSLKDLQKELNTTQKSAKSAQTGIKGFGAEVSNQIPIIGKLSGSLKAFATSPAGIVTGLGLAGAALGKFVVDQAAAIDEIGKLVPVTNASVEALSQYRHVAELSGVEFKKLTNGFSELAIRLGEGTKKTTDALDSLSLDLKTLQNLKSDEAFEEIADALNKIENPAKRAALAAALFGKTIGKDLLKITQAGSEGIRAMREEADEFGKTISGQAAQDAADFNDNLARLSAAFGGVSEAIASLLIGPANDFLGFLVDVIRDTKAATTAVDDFFGSLSGGQSASDILNDALTRLVSNERELAQAVADTGGEFEEINALHAEAKLALDNFVRSTKTSKEELARLRAELDGTTTSLTDVKDEEEKLEGAATKKTKAVKDQSKAFKEVEGDARAHVVAFEKAAEAERVATLELAAFNRELAASESAIDSFIQDINSGTEAIDEQTDALSRRTAELTRGQQAQAALQTGLIGAGGAAVGTLASGGSVQEAAQSAAPAIGSAIGTAVGVYFGGPAGAKIGSFIGGALGSAVASAFGKSEKTPKIKLQTTGGEFDTPLGDTGDTGTEGSSQLANIVIAGSGGRRVPGADKIVRAIEELDNRIAETLTPEQLEAAREGATFSAKDALSSFDFEQRLIERTTAIFDAIGGEMDIAFDMLAGEADLTAQELGDVVDGISALNGAMQEGELSEEFSGTLSEVVAQIDDLKEGNETLLQTYTRVVMETAAVERSLALIGHTSADVGPVVATAIADMAGGIGRLSQLTDRFRNEFLSDDQIAQIDQSIAQASVDSFVEDMDELGFSVDLTRDGFADFILGLDLTTEAGQKAYIAALEAAGALDVLIDAEEAVAAAAQAAAAATAADEARRAALGVGVNVALAGTGAGFGAVSEEAAVALSTLVGGLDELNSGLTEFMSGLFSEEELAEIAIAQAAAQVEIFQKEIESLNMTVDTSEAGFREFVLNLDLSTEAGRAAFAASLEASEAIKTLGDASRDNARQLDESTRAIRDTGNTASTGSQALLDRILESLVGDQFGSTLVESTQLDISRLEKERDDAQAEIRGGVSNFQRNLLNRLITKIDRQIDSRQSTLDAISNLESQFPGFGEERFNLMQEFAPLFDGTDLSELERTTGFAAFRERWQEILDGAADSVLEPLEDIDNRAQDISDYLTDLLLGDSSTLSQADQLALAEQNFNDLVARARSGENISSEELIAANRALNEEIRDTFGFGPEATSRFNVAADALAEIGQQIAAANDQQVLLDQLTALRELLEEMRSLRDAVDTGTRRNARAL